VGENGRKNEGKIRHSNFRSFVIFISSFTLGFIVGILLSKCPGKKEEHVSERKISPPVSESESITPSQEGVGEIIPEEEEEIIPEEQAYTEIPSCYDLPFSLSLIEMPKKLWNKKTAEFVFSPVAIFSCRISDEEFPCEVSPVRVKVYFTEDGPKNFRVSFKVLNCPMLEYDFIVDTYPPITTIVPVGFSELLLSSEAKFRFIVSEPVKYTLCRIDDGFWLDCSRGEIILTNISDGWHKISAFSEDLAGNREETVKHFVFRVDANPPTTLLIEAPPSITNSNSAKFVFIADDEDVNFECNINNTGWVKCFPPLTISDLKEGLNEIKIRGVDNLGRYELSPVVYSWRVVKGEIVGNPKPYVPSERVLEILRKKGVKFEE
jgi:hypothetical protein